MRLRRRRLLLDLSLQLGRRGGSRRRAVAARRGRRREPVEEPVEQSRLLTAPPWSPAGGRRVQSSVCGRRAQGLAGRTRRPGVAVAEGSGSSERRRRRVVAAVAARATCMHARERLPPSCSVRKHGFGGRSWFTDVLPPAEGLPGRRVDRRTRSLRRRTKIPRYARILIIFFSCGGMYVM